MSYLSSRSLVAAAAMAVSLMAAPSSSRAEAAVDEVVRWNELATAATGAAQMDPLTESRLLAMLHLAMHDAVNAIVGRYQSFTTVERATATASVDAAVATAARDVLVVMLPKDAAVWEAAHASTLAALTDRNGQAAGVATGRRAAQAVLARRADDGAGATVAYTPRDVAGDYRPTPPELMPAMFAHWGAVAPFALTSAAQFRPVPPPVAGSARALAEIREIRRIGGASSAVRTAEQSEIAKYWYENSTLGWNRIAREIAAARPMDLAARARFFALINVAMADGFISGFEAKYHYRYWRPVTAIHAAGETTWATFLPTPPVPDHPSTHTVLGAAAARTMARLLGTDLVSFSMISGAPYGGIRRQFYSLSSAARENGASRMFAGIHFRSAVDAGYTLGEQVGDWAVDTLLRPLAADSESDQ
ncbi:MAG TPA: phosphatase PAP2 family protein [Luteitalea sp.]|nr:phosphatase PAP2 family protein [Luteitalea sp.]